VALENRGEHRDDDRRNLAELNHREDEDTALTSQKTLTPWPRIWATNIWTADRAVDQVEVRDRSVFLNRRSAVSGHPELIFGPNRP
jgi:hypothetical protein